MANTGGKIASQKVAFSLNPSSQIGKRGVKKEKLVVGLIFASLLLWHSMLNEIIVLLQRLKSRVGVFACNIAPRVCQNCEVFSSVFL